jgi:hypothetical protein
MRLVIGSFATFWLALSAAQALDLTPQEGVRQGNEGPPTNIMVFTDGQARYGYEPPAGWKSSGGGKTMTFYPQESGASMKLMVIAKKDPQAPGGAAGAQPDLQEWAAKFLPSDAEKPEFVKAVPSPFPMGTRSSSEYIFNFTIAGVRNSLSVAVVEFSDKERLVMLVSANASKFESIRRQAISSMFSWSAMK